MRRILLACAAVALAGACSPSDDAQKTGRSGGSCARDAGSGESIVPVATEAPSGDYTLDKSHASLVFRVDHIGFRTTRRSSRGLMRS
jgi:polyisoprenoid-binding protein YceI